VLARRTGSGLCFLVMGRVTCHHCPALRQYAEEGLACGATSVEVDLRDCTHGDSTFLGTLLHLKRCLDRRYPGAFRLVCPSAEFRQVLAHIGADKLFFIVNDSSATDLETTWQQLDDNADRLGSRCFKENVVQAHQALANAGGQLAERFAPVAEALSQELEAERRQNATCRR
jgi:anti-anti-sigma regulatory factor